MFFEELASLQIKKLAMLVSEPKSNLQPALVAAIMTQAKVVIEVEIREVFGADKFHCFDSLGGGGDPGICNHVGIDW